MTDDQLARLAAINDPAKRAILRRLFERAADAPPIDIYAKLSRRVLDPEAEATRQRWKAR